MLETLQSGA